MIEDIAPVNKSTIHYHVAINSWEATSKNTLHHQGFLLNNPKSTCSCSIDWESLAFGISLLLPGIQSHLLKNRADILII